MFTLNNSYAIGYNQGRIALVEKERQAHIYFLSYLSSICLVSLLTKHSKDEQLQFLQSKTKFQSVQECKAVLLAGQKRVNAYLSETEDSLLEDPVSKWIFPERLFKNTIDSDNVRLDYPVALTVVPTWQCAHRCIYCGVPKCLPETREYRVNDSILLQRIEEAIQAGVQHIDIHGGDPIVYARETTEKLLSLCKKYKISYSLSTKALLTNDQIEKLVCNGLTNIQLSFDSINSRTAAVLGYGKSFRRIFEENLQRLHSYGVKVNVNIVKTRFNENELDTTLSYLQSVGSDSVTVSPLKHGRHQMNDLLPSSDFAKRFQSHPLCSSGRSSLGILPNGKCFYCDFMADNPAYQFGDLTRQSIEDIWNSEELQEILYPSDEMFIDSECKDCKNRSHCVKRGLCYLTALENGIYYPDAYCGIEEKTVDKCF